MYHKIFVAYLVFGISRAVGALLLRLFRSQSKSKSCLPRMASDWRRRRRSLPLRHADRLRANSHARPLPRLLPGFSLLHILYQLTKNLVPLLMDWVVDTAGLIMASGTRCEQEVRSVTDRSIWFSTESCWWVADRICIGHELMLYNWNTLWHFSYNKLIRRWDSEREFSLRRHRTRTTKYKRLVHKFGHAQIDEVGTQVYRIRWNNAI